MRAINPSARRAGGYLLAYVLVVAAIFSVIAMLLLESAETAALNTKQIEVKNESYDAAEAGLNAALEALDLSLLNIMSRTATLPNGYHYTYYIHPNFSGILALTITDPALGPEGGNILLGGTPQISVPAGGAVIVCVGTGPNGERPTTLEAAVTADIALLTYPSYAILSGLNIQGTYASTFAPQPGANTNDPLHANGTITAQGNRSFQATADASGSVNTLPPGTTGTTQVALPVISQFDYMVANYKNQATTYAGSTNVLVPGGAALQPGYTCPLVTPGLGCLLFYDGTLTVTSTQTTFTGPWTLVVNGNLTLTGGGLIFSSKPSLVAVNGNAAINGPASFNGYLEVKGTTALASSATFSGALMSLGTLTFSSGAGGGFTYDPTVIPPGRSMVGLVKIISYAEY